MPMRDPIYPSRDPVATDHPGVPRVNAERELPARATPSAIGHIPAEEGETNPRLNHAAESVGRALGSAVSGVRGIQDKVNEGKQKFTVIRGGAGDAKERVTEAVEQARAKGEELVGQARAKGEELVGKAREKGEELVEQVRDKSGELVEQARTKGGELREQAQLRFEQARIRAEHIARHDPLRVIGVAAMCGVVLGIVLRLWRDHHAG